jgi:hypothetical protein
MSKKITKKEKENLPTFLLTNEEKKIAMEYWNEQGAFTFCILLFLGCILSISIYAYAIRTSPHKNDSFLLFIAILGIASLIYLGRFLSIVSDMQKKQRITGEGIFTKKGIHITNYSHYLHQKIGKRTLIFPPKIYYNIAKGDYVKVHYTHIERVVVFCEKIEPPIKDNKV